ncbi:MAG: family 43 glycosylhydrolase [Bacteroidota bacterium]
MNQIFNAILKHKMKNDLLRQVIMCLIITGTVGLMTAQNPISPPGVYLADPSARSWNDSVLYLYTSTDLSCDFWCSWEHDILYTTDMKEWKLARNVFASKGENDKVLYNDKLLFAPDCEKKGDTYFMYYCQPDKNNALGTAISKNATGPFEGGQILNTGKKYSQIDPSVFIDDDGTAYIVWGQHNMKMAILEKDMRTIDTSTLKNQVLTVKEHYFHEGAYMTKRKGIYYLIFADESRNKTPSCIGYATSDKPFGPYKYGGVIIDNNGCNPGNWNNHGSIFNFKDQWYVFYHRSTHGCEKFRKSCVEKIDFLLDGSIPEVEMTTQGALPPLDAKSIIGAEWACSLEGNVRIEKEGKNNEKLSQMKSGDKATYKYLNFDKGVRSFSIMYNTNTNCKLLLYVGEDQKEVAEIPLTPSSGNTWRKETFDIPLIKGIEALTLELVESEEQLCEIDWFMFSN